MLYQSKGQHREEIVYENGKIQKYSYLDDIYGVSSKDRENSSVFIDAIDIIKRSDSTALPKLSDLPLPKYNKRKRIRPYTGIIQNCSDYQISIPSDNSSGTLIVPAHDWLEYTAWTPTINIYGYVEGKLIYHQKLQAQPKEFPYMGHLYDFVATIKPSESKPKKKPKTRHFRKRRQHRKG